MSNKQGRVIIVGAGEFAEIAYEYLTHDSPYEVTAFTVERAYLEREELFGLPVVPFEEVESRYDPADHGTLVAVTYTKLNRVRTRLYHAVKAKGYKPISYISSHTFVWRNATIGENCFIFENNVIQYHARIGDNVVLWSGNHIGHRATIGDHCFISSHVVISGYCEVGESCFLGVNATVGDKVKIARDCVIGAGAVIVKDTQEREVYRGPRASASEVDSQTLFDIEMRR